MIDDSSRLLQQIRQRQLSTASTRATHTSPRQTYLEVPDKHLDELNRLAKSSETTLRIIGSGPRIVWWVKQVLDHKIENGRRRRCRRDDLDHSRVRDQAGE